MADAFGVYRCDARGELREGIVRMVESVAGEGAEGLDLARGGEPAAHRRSRTAPPVFHARGGVHGPQDERLEYADRHVIARIETFHQLVQAGDVLRRRLAAGIERLPQFARMPDGNCSRSSRSSTSESNPNSCAASSTAAITAVVEALWRCRKKPLMSRITERRVARGGIEAGPQVDEPADGGQPGDERREAGGAQRGEQPHDDSQIPIGESRRHFAPGRQRDGVDAGARLFAGDSQVFAQVEPRAQLVDGLIAGANRLGRRRREEPARQRVLADVRARGAEEFEERAFAEQVEVGGVGVVGGEIAVARFPAPGPISIEAGDRSFEEGGGAALPLELSEQRS
jgi:hypothetical protein